MNFVYDLDELSARFSESEFSGIVDEMLDSASLLYEAEEILSDWEEEYQNNPEKPDNYGEFIRKLENGKAAYDWAFEKGTRSLQDVESRDIVEPGQVISSTDGYALVQEGSESGTVTPEQHLKKEFSNIVLNMRDWSENLEERYESVFG